MFRSALSSLTGTGMTLSHGWRKKSKPSNPASALMSARVAGFVAAFSRSGAVRAHLARPAKRG